MVLWDYRWEPQGRRRGIDDLYRIDILYRTPVLQQRIKLQKLHRKQVGITWVWYKKGPSEPYFARTLSGSFASKLLRFPAQQSPPSNHPSWDLEHLSLSTIRQVIPTHFDHRVLNALLGIASPCREKFEIAPGKLQGVFQLCCLIATGSCARSLPRGMLQALNIDINKSSKNHPCRRSLRFGFGRWPRHWVRITTLSGRSSRLKRSHRSGGRPWTEKRSNLAWTPLLLLRTVRAAQPSLLPRKGPCPRGPALLLPNPMDVQGDPTACGKGYVDISYVSG